MKSRRGRSTLVSITLTGLMLLSSVTGIQMVGAALPSHLSATNPLASSQTGGSNSSLDWTQSTGPGLAGNQGWNYSPQAQINLNTVSNLAISFIFPVPSIWTTPVPFSTRFPGLPYSTGLEGAQTPVLTQGGVGYITTNGLSVYAIDLATGKLLSQDNPSMDWNAFAKSPVAPTYGPGHLHGVNMVNGVIWVPGFGCQLQGWNALSGVLVANLTNLCDNIPGNYSPHTGWGQYYPYGDAAVQVDAANNVILFNMGAAAEGSGGGRMFIEGCSLSAALQGATDKALLASGKGCVAKGGACTTVQGGVCSAGSSLLWRTFLMPAIDGSTPTFSIDICKGAHVWIGGVPCSSMNQTLIQNDWQNLGFKNAWNGTTIGPNSGLSNSWGNYALDDSDGLFFVGSSQTGPDWNATYRPGPNLAGDSVLALSLKNGSIVWADKTVAKDLNDYDCNLNVIYAQVNGQKMVLKACKSGIIYGINAITGQPMWVLDPNMPDYKTLGASTSSLSKPFECQAGNNTSCNIGATWDKIYQMYNSGQLKMKGSNPRPHGFVSPGPYRASVALNPLNNTEMNRFICPIGTNAQCQSTAGVGNVFGCPEFSQNVSSKTPSCPSLENSGKTGFTEGRYFMESENAFDGTYFYVVVEDGPMEHDYISDVQYKGNTGLTFDTNLYFAGTMQTNATVMALDPATGNIVWNYTRPIYYRGGIIATGGMIVTQWPDGHVVFLNSANGQVVRDMSFGLPLLAPMSIAPDVNGAEHLLIDFGGTQHAVLGEVGLHGALGHGYIVPGAVISLALSQGGSGTVGPSPSGGGGSTIDTYSYAFYVLLATVVVLAIVAGALVVRRGRTGPGVGPT